MARNNAERLRKAIVDASQRLEISNRNQAQMPSPGNLYVFATPVEATIEWLFVRAHPDDSSLVLLAPVDDFPFAGLADVSLMPEFTNRPLTVRCGETTWLPVEICQEHVDTLSKEAVSAVRQKLASLARGIISGDQEAMHVETDPEYIEWLEEVGFARRALETACTKTGITKGLTMKDEETEAIVAWYQEKMMRFDWLEDYDPYEDEWQ